jgi:hypothetical protein
MAARSTLPNQLGTRYGPARRAATTAPAGSACAATTGSTPARQAGRTSPGRSRDSEVSESDWWKDTGNPKVFAFRDCISGYARAQARVRPKVNLQGILAEAIKGDCKSSFSNVSAVLAERFGSRKAKQMASELTGSTFVPALRSAVLDVRKQQKAARRQQQRAQAVASTASSACPGLATTAAGKCPRPGARGGRKSSRTTARGPAA